MGSSKETAKDTLALFDERLRRIDYILNGDAASRDSETTTTTGSAIARLRHLERAFGSLSARSPAVAEVLALQRAYPAIFQPTAVTKPDALPLSTLTSLVLAQAPLYTSLSANLTQLADTLLPDPATLTKLIELQTRIDKLQAKQEQQAREFAELRARSARAIENWYEAGVLQMGEQWAEWEERVRDAEILVRRREAAKRREEGLV